MMRQGANCCYIDNVKLLQDLIKNIIRNYMGNSPVTDGTFWGFFCPCKVSLELINNFFPDILIYPKST